MITEAPKRHLVLFYSLDSVRRSITEVCKLSEFNLRSRNDAFGTYTIAIVRGIRVGILNVTLEGAGDGSTKAQFEIYNAAGGTASPVILNDLQDYFLNCLASHLEGKLTIQDVKTDHRKGYKTLWLILILVAAAMALLKLLAPIGKG